MGIKTAISLLLCMSTSLQPVEKPKFTYIPMVEKTVEVEKKDLTTLEEVFAKVDEMDFKFKDILKAQIVLESGNLQSRVFLQNKNCLGLREAKTRVTTSNGSNLGYAKYDSVELCLYDRLLYETKYLEDLNRKEYLKYLGEVYSSGGEDYISQINKIIELHGKTNR